MNDKLKAELNKRIVTIFDNIHAVNQLINEDYMEYQLRRQVTTK